MFALTTCPRLLCRGNELGLATVAFGREKEDHPPRAGAGGVALRLGGTRLVHVRIDSMHDAYYIPCRNTCT